MGGFYWTLSCCLPVRVGVELLRKKSELLYAIYLQIRSILLWGSNMLRKLKGNCKMREFVSDSRVPASEFVPRLLGCCFLLRQLFSSRKTCRCTPNHWSVVPIRQMCIEKLDDIVELNVDFWIVQKYENSQFEFSGCPNWFCGFHFVVFPNTTQTNNWATPILRFLIFEFWNFHFAVSL